MEKQIYEIMHENEKTAEIDTAGHSKIYREDLCPMRFIWKRKRILILW